MKQTRVFICYRRDDTTDFAARLRDQLSKSYGDDNVVLDVDIVPIGAHFQKYLDRKIQECDLLLTLIGRQWLEVTDPNGSRRLDNPHDHVRLEIESALQRELPVIPVLVSGARMPREDELPPSLATLSYINAANISSDRDFKMHVDMLVKAIDSLVQEAAQETVFAPPPTAPPDEVITSIGEQLLETLKQKLDKLRPKTPWVWTNHKGWWSAHEQDSSRLVIRARLYRNLIRIRVRKNTGRPMPAGLKLSYGNWIAETPGSFVHDRRELDRFFRIVKAEWG